MTIVNLKSPNVSEQNLQYLSSHLYVPIKLIPAIFLLLLLFVVEVIQWSCKLATLLLLLQEEERKLFKLENERIQMEKLQKQKEQRDVLINSARAKMKRLNREKQEELALDMKILERLFHESQEDTEGIKQRKVREKGICSFSNCATMSDLLIWTISIDRSGVT